MSDTGNPLLSQPPTTVNVGDVAQQEVDPRNEQKLRELGKQDAGSYAALWAAYHASQIDGKATIGAQIIGFLDWLASYAVEFMTNAQGEKTAGFWDLAAAVTEDLVGVPVDADKLKQARFGSGRLAGMDALGGGIFDLLQKEFAPDGTLSPDQGVNAAKTFLGFLMSFAIRQGNIENLVDALPEEVRFLEGLRGYGELMAKNLGLGRMARRALQPLIQTTIADPLTWKLNTQYRPKQLAKEQAIKAYFRQVLDLTTLRTELAQEGYSDARQDFMIDDSRPITGDRELIRLFFRGQIADPDFTKEFSARGYGANEQFLTVEAERPFLEKNEIALLYVNQKIDRQTALDLLKQLGFDTSNAAAGGLSTADLVLDAHSLSHAHAHRLGLGVLKKMLHDNVIDVLEFAAQLAAQGYSQSDIQLLQLEFLQPTTGKLRQLSLAEIKAGFKAGALTELQAEQHLKTLNYSDADIAVILKTLPTPKAPTPPATPAA